MEKFLEWVGLQTDESSFVECPAHADSRPSLKVYGGTKGWYCFSCNRGGGPVEFYQLLKEKTKDEAAEEIAAAFGLSESLIDRVRLRLDPHTTRKDRATLSAWHMAVTERWWRFYHCLPEYLNTKLLKAWHDYAIERIEFACDVYRKKGDPAILQWVADDLADFICQETINGIKEEAWLKRRSE